jgi:hypothetical protein
MTSAEDWGSGLSIGILRVEFSRARLIGGHEGLSSHLGRLGYGGCSAERDVKGMFWERVTADR